MLYHVLIRPKSSRGRRVVGTNLNRERYRALGEIRNMAYIKIDGYLCERRWHR